MFGLGELAIVLIVVIALLVAKKGPELARSAGKAARVLKAEARAMKEQEKEEDAAPAARAPRIVKGETVAPGTGSAAAGPEAPPAPGPERTAGTPPRDGTP
jgi:sec-independent protein translocase protein TatA